MGTFGGGRAPGADVGEENQYDEHSHEARTAGFEPTTPASGGQCSIQLSYVPVSSYYYYGLLSYNPAIAMKSI